MSGAKKISQLVQKNTLDDDDLFVIRDSVSLDNRSVKALDMRNYFGGGSSLPNGSNGDVLIHNGSNWAIGNVVEVRNIAWFQANANNVLRKNITIILDEDRRFFKVSDGVTTLKNLRWYSDRGLSDISIGGFNGVIGMNTTTNKDVGLSIYGLSATNTGNITLTNEFRGTFGVLPEPIILEQLGLNVALHNATGGSVQVELAIYQPDFAARNCTLITKTNLSPLSTGRIFFNVQSPVLLPSGVYLFAFRYAVPSGSYFSIHYFNLLSPILNTIDNTYLLGSFLLLTGQTSIPNTCPFPTSTAAVTYYFYWSGQRILKNI